MKYLFLTVLLLVESSTFAQQQGFKEIVQKMNVAVKNLHTAKFSVYGEERLKNGSMFVSERMVKLNVNPQKVYFYSITPDPGMEVLWKRGANEKMLVYPGGFPYITLKINHTGSVARKDSHHSIEDMGFEYVNSLINYYMQLYGDAIIKSVKIVDTVQWQNRSCIHLYLDFKDFKPVNYVVKEGETVSTIASKIHVNDYMIMSMNSSVDDLEDVSAGQQIMVPNFYCSRLEFYIDRNTWLPVKQLIYDPKGLYEKYEFRNLLVNPPLSPDEFTSDYKDYKF